MTPALRAKIMRRFRSKYIVQESGCWEWTGRGNGKGYGRFWDGSRVVRAHRWSYEHHIGPIADGLQIDHLCRVRNCVNPHHLEAVTSGENTRRSPVVKERMSRLGKELGGRVLRQAALAQRKYDLPEGVTPNRSRYSARIWDSGTRKHINLGTFQDPETAGHVYRSARTWFLYAGIGPL